MERTTELIAEPGERVEVFDGMSWCAGEVNRINWEKGEPPAYRVATDSGLSLWIWDESDIRKPEQP